MNNNNRGSSGLGLSTVLTLIFLVLKLVGVINWSWWVVFSPWIINAILWVIVFLIYVAVVMYYEGFPKKKGKKDKWKF